MIPNIDIIIITHVYEGHHIDTDCGCNHLDSGPRSTSKRS